MSIISDVMYMQRQATVAGITIRHIELSPERWTEAVAAFEATAEDVKGKVAWLPTTQIHLRDMMLTPKDG